MIQLVKKINNVYTGQLDSYLVTFADGIISTVPIDERNTDYQAILKWVAEGNTIQEAD
jgi:hypothetical protein